MGTPRIPILKVGGALITSLQAALSDSAALQFTADLRERLRTSGARAIIVDLAALELADGLLGRLVADLGSMASLTGADVILTGPQPAVALALGELALPRTHLAHDLERGLTLLFDWQHQEAQAAG